MSGMNVTERRSGLLLAEQSAIPRDIRDALKNVDARFVLAQEVDARHECWVWRVFVRMGDRPAVWFFDWREDMSDPYSKPRPLSHGIVEEAAVRRLDSRRPQIDPLEHNDRIREELRQEMREISEQAAAEAKRKVTSPVHRSQALRMSRDKQRRKGRNV